MSVTTNIYSTTGLTLWNGDLSTPSFNGILENSLTQWLGEICNMETGAIVAGSGYQDGVYQNVELIRNIPTPGGRDVKATITVAGGAVSDVQITKKGNGFKAGDVLIVKNIAQVGGTGTGFTIDVTAGDASLGLIHSPSLKLADQFMNGFVFGVDRSTSYDHGAVFYKSSSTSTSTFSNVYNYYYSTSNSGYGTWSYTQSSYSLGTWYQDDEYQFRTTYCAEPDNRFWMVSDSRYKTVWGFFEVVRPDEATNNNYPSKDIASKWTTFIISSDAAAVGYHVMTTDTYNKAYTGFDYRSLSYPTDPLVFFSNHIIRGRSLINGYLPSRLNIHSATNPTSWDSIVTGDTTDTYRHNSHCLYVKEN